MSNLMLEVFGQPTFKANGPQKITINYDPMTERTIIVCSADIVTTGIACKILADKFNEALCALDVETAYEICSTIAKVGK